MFTYLLIAHFLTFYGISGLCAYLDLHPSLLDENTWIVKFRPPKGAKGTKMEDKLKAYKYTPNLFYITFRSFIFENFMLYLACKYRDTYGPYKFSSNTYLNYLYSSLFIFFIMDFGHYILHYIFHHKYFYRWCHKKHHVYTNPVALSSKYYTLIESFEIFITSTLPGLLIAPTYIFYTRIHLRYNCQCHFSFGL